MGDQLRATGAVQGSGNGESNECGYILEADPARLADRLKGGWMGREAETPTTGKSTHLIPYRLWVFGLRN